MLKRKAPQPIKPQQADNASNLPDGISQGLGYLVMWAGSTTQTYQDMKQRAVDAKLPTSITENIVQHSVEAALGLAKNDARWKKVIHNDSRVEAKVLSHDPTTGTTVMEFLGYETTQDQKGGKKGKRTHLDAVAIDNNGSWLSKGKTDIAKEFIALVDDHRAMLRGQDLYAMITAPTLKAMRRVRIARNCFYVANSKENNELIQSLDTFMASVGYNLICLTQKDDQRTKDGLTARIKEDLTERISDVVSKVADWKSKNRVHGRSSKKVFEELTAIFEDTKEMESALSVSLENLQKQIQSCRDEANVIIANQAPTGINTLIYDDFEKAMKRPGNLLQDTENGAIFMVSLAEKEGNEENASLSQYVNGDSLKKDAVRALKQLGYYSYIKDSLMILRPIAELTNSVAS